MPTETSAPRRKLSAIVMVDVSGFSRMMGRDEERTTARIREFHERTKGLVESHEGRVVDTAGDSVFGEFDSVINAVRCAQAIQQAQALANAGVLPAEQIHTRIGVHLGDVIVQDYHVYGDGVNIAARLQSIASPGGICVSEAVYQQVYQKLDLAFEDLGMRELKNIEHPIRLYRVVGGDSGGTSTIAVAGPDSESALPAAVSSWRDALLYPASLIPLLVGGYLLTTLLGLPPTGRIFPIIGAVLVGVGTGQALRLRTRQRGFFLIALGAGLLLAALIASSRSDRSLWALLLAGVVVIAIGLTRLRTPSRERK